MAKQRKRRRSSEDEGLHPLAGPVDGPNKVALRAFRLSLWSLIPGAGLILGPVAAGTRQYRQSSRQARRGVYFSNACLNCGYDRELDGGHELDWLGTHHFRGAVHE